jgi:hypothetical protein
MFESFRWRGGRDRSVADGQRLQFGREAASRRDTHARTIAHKYGSTRIRATSRIANAPGGRAHKLKRMDPGRWCIFLMHVCGGFLGVSRAVAHQTAPRARACAQSRTQTRQASEAHGSKTAFVINLVPLLRRGPWRLVQDEPGADLGAQRPVHVLSLRAPVAASSSEYVRARCCVVSKGYRPEVFVATSAVERNRP